MESIDYDKVVADLEAKREAFNAAIDAAIHGIKHVLSAVQGIAQAPQNISGSHIPSGSSLHSPSVTTAEKISPAAFFGLSIAQAVIKYLQLVKRQQTTREIADALMDAGFHHTSQNFVNTVNTALYRRERDEADVVRVGRNWALTEWYPGRRRQKGKDSAAETEAKDGGNDGHVEE